MSDFNTLSQLLPSQVTIDVSLEGLRGNSAGEESYADITIENSILAGNFDGYCIDTDTPVGAIENNLTAEVFSIYETIPPEFLTAIDNPDNLDLVGWILNQSFVGKDSSAVGEDIGTFTFSDIQAAIWTLLGESFNPNGNDLPDLGNDTTDPNALNLARVNKIIELAEANGTDFVPSYEYTTIFGESVIGQLGVLLFPDEITDDSNPYDTQPFIVGVELAKLGDRVFLDTDADGIQDAGEEGIAGVTVNLLADVDGDGVIEDGEVIHTTTTDADGNYHFEVIAGDYKVEFEQPDGFEVSPANQGGDDTVDSDGLISDVVTLNPGENDPTIDQGFYETAGLGDFVFEDTNGNGIQDAGENGVEGVLVKLQNPDGSAVLDDANNPITTTTAADGSYSFTGLTPGEYKVMFVAPEGFEFTNPNQGGNDAVDSDADPTMNGMTQTVVLESGDFNDTLDAGLVQPASLGDFVFEDDNANGIQDSGEDGIAGVEVKLLADLDNDGQIDDVVETDITEADGSYGFDGLTPGVEYKVMFTQPDGFDSVSPFQAGGDNTVDSDADPNNGLMSDVVVLASGENNPTIDAGFFKTAGLGDFVFEDTNGNGIQDAGENGVEGVLVKLQNSDGSAVLDDANNPITTTTAADGSYSFTGLTPGEYKVMFVAPDGFEFTTANVGGNDAVDSDADPTMNGMTQTVVLESGDFNDTLDAGLVQPASLGDFVFEDDNANGIQDSGEDGIAGVEVKLLADLDNDGQIDDVVETDITEADGSYGFDGLTPGVEYKVMFTQPDGFDSVSPFQAGGDNTVDSDADPNNGLMSDVVVLASGENNPTIDAGFFKTAGLGDFVFEDTNGNGIQDAGENGVEGVLVKLQNSDGSAVLDDANNPITTTTAADGSYSFTGLTPGEYKVMFVAPDGFEFTTANVGGNDAVDSDADPTMNGMTQTVVLESGDFNDTLDAGLIQLIPGIDIEKFTNGVDADNPDQAAEIVAGDTVIWTYEVTNTGEVDFDQSEIVVTDDQEGLITNIIDKGDGDNLLEVGETWIYQKTGIAQDLFTSVNTVIDFETDGSGNPLAAGTVIDTEYSNLGVTISATEFGAMIFDSANPTGGDNDLATDSEGNILIISEDGDSSDPDDDAGGGVITFDLDNPVTVNSINFVDIEETGGNVFTTDADGNVTTTAIPAPGDGSLQTLNINDSDVVKIEVDLIGSGAISGLDFDTITDGIYKNTGTVVAGDVTDADHSHYINLPVNPSIDIEKFTNGVDADTLLEAPEIAVGETVTWTYEVTNTGDVSFMASDIVVTDDQEGLITNIIDQGDGDDTLAPGETWTYEQTGIAQDLTTTTSSQDIRFYLTGNSSTTGHFGNVRTFTEEGVSVDVSAFSFNPHAGWRTAYLGAYGGGLGVTNQNEGGSGHRVDNGGSVDYVLFEFDQEVTVDRAFLDYISHDSDISIWIGDRNVDITYLNSQILDGFTKENNNGGAGGSDNARWADFNDNELTGDTLVIAARDDDHDDAFKLKKLDISVPGETTIGNYVNIGTVTADSVSDSDMSGYTNPVPSDPIKTTLHFSGNSPLDGHDGNVRTFSEDGLSVDVSAFSRGKDALTGQWKDAYLGAYSDGLGVTDQSEGTHAHRVDNLGHNFNYVMFKFSKEVEVDRAYFDSVVDDADAKFWIGDTDASSLNDALLASFYSEISEDPGIGSYDPRWADINDGGLTGNTLIIAANTDEPTFEDSFKINKLEVHHF